jgi:beta-N-acetylhexosaminidase
MMIRLLLMLGLAFSLAAQSLPVARRAAKSTLPAPVRAALASMSLEEEAAQLIVAPFYGENPHHTTKIWREIDGWVHGRHIGGLILLNRVQQGIVNNAEPFETAAFLNRIQRRSKLPLIIGGDFERGASMRLKSTTRFPHLMAFGAADDLGATRALGLATARESRALGFHWIFAPDADVNNNPANPIINTRSFGEQPQRVAEHVKAFIDGAHSLPGHPVLVTVKHFPGHGDTATDSHIGLARIDASRERMDQVEFVPFRAAIAQGVDAVMSAHLHVPALEPEEIPGTVSKKIMTDLLRTEFGFQGLITTDAMDMQGLTKMFSPAEAAVRSVEAGVDVLLVPASVDQSIDGLVRAVRSGRLSRERLRASVTRILMAKYKLGLFTKRLVDLENISEATADPEHESLSRNVAARALSVLRSDSALLPLPDPAQACVYVLAENRFSSQGQAMLASWQARVPKGRIVRLDPQTSSADIDAHLAQTGNCASLVVAAFVNVAAYRGDVALRGEFPRFVRSIFSSSTPSLLVSLGSPYLARSFPEARNVLTTFSSAPSAEEAAIRALLGEVKATAKPPVTISAP